MYQFCRDLENRFETLNSEDLAFLKKAFEDLRNIHSQTPKEIQLERKNSTQPADFDKDDHFQNLDKLAKLSVHLKIDMTLRHFQNILVPLERWLDRSVKDDDFLIRHQDVAKSPEAETYPLVLVLDHLRSAFNVGSFFRLADSLGIQKIILTGYTPTPENKSVQKTALGSETSVPWEFVADLPLWLSSQKQTHRLVGWETTDQAIPCDHQFSHEPTIFIFGNERFGLEKSLLKQCHEIREIKMSGLKNSLNVGQSAAIAAYEWRRQWLNAK